MKEILEELGFGEGDDLKRYYEDGVWKSDGISPEMLAADCVTLLTGCSVYRATCGKLKSENERLRSGLRGIRREFGHMPINNGTATVGMFIDALTKNDVEKVVELEKGI